MAAKKKKSTQLTDADVAKLKRAKVDDDKKADSRPDEQVLVDYQVIKTPIGEITLRPWSYGDYYPIADKIEDIFEIIEGLDINFDAFGEVGFFESLFSKLNSEDITEEHLEEFQQATNKANKSLRKIINRTAPLLMPLLVTTTGKESEELDKLPLNVLVLMVWIIYSQNIGILGNALGLFGAGAE